jgi:DNA-directed RNA polymerase specialized sigma24 family protein
MSKPAAHVTDRRLDGTTREEVADGLSDAQIAPLLGVSRARVFYLRQRALQKIRAGILADPVLRELASDCCGIDL